jgi:hypothetical protein
MQANKNYKCKICDTHQEDLKKPLMLNACPRTGKVRGFLCDNCAAGLKKLDNPASIMTALDLLGA